MTRLLTLGVGLLAAFATLGSALADEPPPEKKRAPVRAAPVRAAPARVAPAPRAEPVRQASNWSGGQVGGSNGGSFANNAFAEPGSFICPPGATFGVYCYETPFSFKGHPAGYTIGPFLGYRVQLGSFVVGIEGDVSYKDTESSVGQATNVQINPVVGGSQFNYLRNDNFAGTLKQGWDGSVRGRIGVLVTPWTLIYGTGGVALERVSGSLTYVGTVYGCSGPGVSCTTLVGTATASTSFSETRVGATGGAGVEFQLGQSPFGGSWTAKIEYRYTDFGSFSKSFAVYTACATCTSPSSGATIDLHPSFQTVRVGLGFGF